MRPTTKRREETQDGEVLGKSSCTAGATGSKPTRGLTTLLWALIGSRYVQQSRIYTDLNDAHRRLHLKAIHVDYLC